MASYTPNLGLIKPAGSDNVAVQQLNSNMDVLDEVVHENTQKIDGLRISNPPYIDETTHHWMVFDPDTQAYVDSGYNAVGEKGDQGIPGPVASVNGVSPDSQGNVSLPDFGGATSSVAGTRGMVPAPAAGENNLFLCGNGDWVEIHASGSALGFLPIVKSNILVAEWTEISGGKYKYEFQNQNLTADMYFVEANACNYDDTDSQSYIEDSISVSYNAATHIITLITETKPTGPINIYLGLAVDGAQVLDDVSELTTPFIGATTSADGREGLVPQPLIADRAKFLQGNGSWVVPGASEISQNAISGQTNVNGALSSLSGQIVNLQDGLATPSVIGSTNNTGDKIINGTYFRLNDVLCVATAEIANGATFTANTNYRVVSEGGLNSLKAITDTKLKGVTGLYNDGIELRNVNKTAVMTINSTNNTLDTPSVWMEINIETNSFRLYKDIGNGWVYMGSITIQ